MPEPEPKIRFYLHSKVAASGPRPVFLSVGVGEARPVRQASGYSLHPAYFSGKAPHALKGADGYRTIKEKLDELRLAISKACHRLEDQGQFSNAALASLTGRAPKPLKAKAPTAAPPSTLPLAQQPMRAVLGLAGARRLADQAHQKRLCPRGQEVLPHLGGGAAPARLAAPG